MKFRLFFVLFLAPFLAVGQQPGVTVRITGITNGSAVFVLQNVKSNEIYEVLGTQSLTNTTWNVEATLQTSSNQSSISTNIPLSAGSNGPVFFRAADVGPAVAGSFVSQFIGNGLVEWNRFNDDSGAVAADSSGNGNALPLIGSPVWTADWLSLDGSTQYGDAGSNQLASLDMHDVTICAWINKRSSSFKALVDKSFSIPGVGHGGWSFRIQTNNALDWWVQDGQDIQDSGVETITPGQWVFVTVAWHYANKTADFYLDGVRNSSVGNGGGNETASEFADFEVGNMQNNLSNGLYAFDGLIRDVAIYNRALSASEIGSNFLGSEMSTNVSTPDLLYYKMTEHAQTNPPAFLADSSTHGGTIGAVFSAPPTTLQWVTNVAQIPETALHFNGDSTHIDTSNSVLFDFTTNQFTVNFWVRPLTENGFVMANGILMSNGWNVRIGGAYQAVFGTESNGVDSVITTGPGAAQNGVFTMVTVVRCGPTNALIYINGIPAATTGSIIVPAPSTNSLMIGTDASVLHILDGDLWLPQIWGEALAPADVANLYFQQLPGQPWP